MTSATARVSRDAVFVDITGRVQVQRMALVAVVMVAALVYANALANGFVLDDGAVVRTNAMVTEPGGVWRVFALPYWPEWAKGGQYRPLAILSFKLDWLISGGTPMWFHAVNVLWHVAATVLTWKLASELLSPASALVTGLVFAVHPVHVEAVANVVGRLECMAAVFVLAAMLAHHNRSRLAPLWFALSLLSKESAIVFIALAAAHDLLLTTDWRAALRVRKWWYAAYGAITAAFAIVLFLVFHARSLTFPARGFTGTDTLDRLSLVTKIVPHYVRLLLAPAELSAVYGPNVIAADPAISLSSLVGVAVLIVLGIAIVVTAYRRRWPEMAFALAWVPIALSPTSNVLFPSVWLAERTLYLPSVGACLALGLVAERFWLSRPRAVAIATAAVLLAFAIRTYTRTPVWRDDRTFLITLLRDHPESYEAHAAAARILKAAARFAEAENEFAIARRLFPRDPLVYRDAADLAHRQGKAAMAAALLDSARFAPTFPLRPR